MQKQDADNTFGRAASRLAVNDPYPTEWKHRWKRRLRSAGHPGPNGRRRTRKDMEEQIAFNDRSCRRS